MIRGIELEDDGGPGTVGSHWEARVLGVSLQDSIQWGWRVCVYMCSVIIGRVYDRD
jgi:hypothetical protein